MYDHGEHPMTRRSKKSPPVKPADQSFEPIESFRHRGGSNYSDDQLLGLLADTINSLRKRVAEDLIEIGFRLTEAKALVGHGGWLPWLERSFGWTERTAQRYMSVYELMAKYDIMSDLDLPMTTLVQLAAPSTPPEAVEAVIDRTEAGEKLTGADVKKTIDKAKGKKSTKEPKKERDEDYNTEAEEAGPYVDAATLKMIGDVMAELEASGQIPRTIHSRPLPVNETVPEAERPNGSVAGLVQVCKVFGLKEVIAALIKEYGYDAVSDAVLEYTP
jgi:hypothetical protein